MLSKLVLLLATIFVFNKANEANEASEANELTDAQILPSDDWESYFEQQSVNVVNKSLSPSSSMYRAFSHSPNIGSFGTSSNWMEGLCDSTPLTYVSIPGTHDSADIIKSPWNFHTQSASITNQLHAGIRAFDIRARNEQGDLMLYHGIISLDRNLGSVLDEFVRFLQSSAKDFIIMRLKNSNNGPWQDFRARFRQNYLSSSNYGAYFYDASVVGGTWATVSDVRGKIVVLQEFGVPVSQIDFKDGIEYGNKWNMDIQGEYALDSMYRLYRKWEYVWRHIPRRQNDHKYYISGLNGAFSGFPVPGPLQCVQPALEPQIPVLPYMVASGLRNLIGGGLKNSFCQVIGNDDLWYDFPRGNCWGTWCSIFYKGINTLYYDWMPRSKFVGIIMMDFPGIGLIERIVQGNANVWASHPNCQA